MPHRASRFESGEEYYNLYKAGVGKLAKSSGLDPEVMEVRILSPVLLPQYPNRQRKQAQILLMCRSDSCLRYYSPHRCFGCMRVFQTRWLGPTPGWGIVLHYPMLSPQFESGMPHSHKTKN